MKLRDYQNDAVQSVIGYFESGNPGHPVIVMPTGTGKSLVIAELVRRVLAEYPAVRVLVLTHVKELIQQNLDKLLRVWPDAPAGIYSAGLRRADTDRSILFCGIQSVFDKAKALASEARPIELVMIDECHRVPLIAGGTWRRFIRDLAGMNPHMRIIGLTATPYRHVPGTRAMTGGYLSLIEGDDRLFTDIVYDLSKSLVRLIRDDYLAALWPRQPGYRVDLKGVKIENGDYRSDQLNALMERSEVIDAILDEAIPLARADDRRHWLVFCAGVQSARGMADNMVARGISARVVTGDTSALDRDLAIRDFRAGRLTALVSVGVLTTGFDAPVTDCLIVARPTVSPVLYVQMMGRGMRPTEAKIAAEGERKRGCLVLDFCGNVDRHGPIDDLRLKKPAPKKAEPKKTCPGCGAKIGVFANPCPECGQEFQREETAVKAPKAGMSDIIAGIGPPVEPIRYDVSRVAYSRHVGKSKIPTLRVDYFSGFLRVASEWVCFQHPPGSYPRKRAERWWDARFAPTLIGVMTIIDVRGAIEVIRDIGILEPAAIRVLPGRTARDYPEIVSFEWPTIAA